MTAASLLLEYIKGMLMLHTLTYLSKQPLNNFKIFQYEGRLLEIFTEIKLMQKEKFVQQKIHHVIKIDMKVEIPPRI